ncbi:hypothetical protein [Thaumasiovibrio sp. DFM-14]|uniref:hypothetical protein n=1 Tax=Thaumasiovibrio sp. DFM-14 TaxID=3384792 RepID=UPI0039A2B75E
MNENGAVLQEREFSLSRLETDKGVFRAEGYAILDGISVTHIRYAELWKLGPDGWVEIELSEQQEEVVAESIFDDVATAILQSGELLL